MIWKKIWTLRLAKQLNGIRQKLTYANDARTSHLCWSQQPLRGGISGVWMTLSGLIPHLVRVRLGIPRYRNNNQGNQINRRNHGNEGRPTTWFCTQSFSYK